MEKITPPFTRKNVFFGVLDRNLKKLENRLDVSLSIRGEDIFIDGSPKKVEFAKYYFEKVRELEERGHDLKAEDFHIVLDILEGGQTAPLEHYTPPEALNLSRKSVTAKSLNQHAYLEAIKNQDVVFGIGPAGTGKTYLAVAVALAYLARKKYRRIILTRPAVEAGEKLGYLPGDIIEKVNPYLRPLYDALNDMMDIDKSQALIDRGIIEVAPLAFMRGRTLNASFIILDEAQNTTIAQMQMFLTRLGFDSKAIIAGDITQVDLPKDTRSGLIDANERLQGIPGLSFCYFTEKDVVRHPLVQEIIRRYGL